jgi:homoserine O-acetyltransferase/O-succinyltransferase
MEFFHYNNTFQLENGAVLPQLTIAYNTYGRLNKEKNNAIWICHALTANSEVQTWWPGMVGDGLLFDTDKYFIVCANIVGSCYGTTGPLSENRTTGKPYYSNFPQVTIRDMVAAHSLLRQYLGINKIHLLAGGSMGGYQALEWCIMEPYLINQLFLIATSARESAWGIAIHTAQRLAIEADNSWKDETPNAGSKGLKAARAIGMITYRSYHTYQQTQIDDDFGKLDHFKASSYIDYQGSKLVNRFNTYSYWLLTKAMDSHNIARHRGDNIAKVLRQLTQRTMIMSITSDLLCPMAEGEGMAQNIPNADFIAIHSLYGHDGFLIETDQITHHVKNWLGEQMI